MVTMRLLFAGWLLLAGSALAQQPESYSRKNTFTVFSEYSPDSSRILLGATRHRILVDLGVGYTRRLVRFREVALGYQAEVRPAVFESDPIAIENYTDTIGSSPPFTGSGVFTSVIGGVCQSGSGTVISSGTPTYTLSYNNSCGRQWTFGQAFSPIGFKVSMRDRHKVQPFVAGTLGYLYTSRPIPLPNAEGFNYFINLGAGVELFRAPRRSVSLEYRWNHISNWNTAEANPGIDNMVVKLSYSFGR